MSARVKVYSEGKQLMNVSVQQLVLTTLMQCTVLGYPKLPIEVVTEIHGAGGIVADSEMIDDDDPAEAP